MTRGDVTPAIVWSGCRRPHPRGGAGRWALAGLLAGLLSVAALPTAWGYWIWTPKTGKWVNPRTQPKETPQAQLQEALTVWEAKDYPRALREFLRLVQHYPKSSQAPEALLYAGQCDEALHRPYQAFQRYKTLLEVYPYSPRFKEAVARAYAIGEALAQGEKIRPLQPVPVAFPAFDKAVEIFETIVAQAPYGECGDRAQFRLGQTLRTLGRYDEAMAAFEKVVHEYTQSPLVEDARYHVAFCAKQLSLKPSYDQAATDQAITWFEEFIASHPTSELREEAQRSLQQLRIFRAESLFRVAEFYRRQRKWPSAVLYYQLIVGRYAETVWGPQAVARLTELEQQGVVKGQGLRPVERAS